MTKIPEEKQRTALFLLVTIISGIVALWPYQDFQYWIAQGDHGRDLYAFQKTMEGQLPYRDFFWVFGPLMPYYYAAFFKIFGLHIQSILLGQNLLFLCAGVLTFLAARVFMAPSLAYVAALWYWAFRGMDFFYTYNHAGGIVALLAAVYCLFLYVRQPLRRYAVTGSLALLLLMLIRFNMGVACLAAFLGNLLLIDVFLQNPDRRANRLFFVGLTGGMLALAVLIYFLFLYPLPAYVFYQSFPFKKSMRTDMTPSLTLALRWLWEYCSKFSTTSIPKALFSGVVLLSLTQTLLPCWPLRKISSGQKKGLAALFITTSLLGFTLHEFLLSGVFYRLSWCTPLVILFCFLALQQGTQRLSAQIRLLVALTLLFLGATTLLNDNTIITLSKQPQRALTFNGKKIYTNQPPDWFLVVQYTSEFIKKTVPPGEKIFALPFDPLYYFLSGHDSANRQLIFFKHTNIPPQQEQDVIKDLVQQDVKYIFLSNRCHAVAEDLGIFGIDCCPTLYQYIKDNYDVLMTVGPWSAEPGWAWDHAVRILKKKPAAVVLPPAR